MWRIYGVFFLSCFVLNTLHAKPKTYPCIIYRLPVPDMPSGDVAFVNGVNHKPERAIKCGSLLSNLSGGYNVFVIYNPTHGLLGDLRKCFHELFRFKLSQPVGKLHEMWDYFFETAGPHERLLQFCHSEGAIQVRNALIRYPENLRRRIIVVAIAPGAYIDQGLCYKTYHYVSRRDIVPLLDRKGFKRCRDRVCVLTPHQDAAFFDHHFLSPTYRPAIYHHLNRFVESGGKECD